jgi:hypothetical protein
MRVASSRTRPPIVIGNRRARRWFRWVASRTVEARRNATGQERVHAGHSAKTATQCVCPLDVSQHLTSEVLSLQQSP